jgi:hypothetical protein
VQYPPGWPDAHALAATPTRELRTVYESLSRENSAALGSVPREIPFAVGSPISRDVPRGVLLSAGRAMAQPCVCGKGVRSFGYEWAILVAPAAFAIGSYGDPHSGDSQLDYYSMAHVLHSSRHAL